MALDIEAAKALEFEPHRVTAERGRLAFFAKAIGETDPAYSDIGAAKAAGHPDLPVPPTYLFSMELDSPDPFGYLAGLGVDLRRVLHGEQSFTYHLPVYAGDTVTLHPRIVDAYSKRGGAMEFVVKQTDFTRDGVLVAELSTVIIVRNPEVTA